MKEEAFAATKGFVESKQSVKRALKCLKPGKEIRIFLEGRQECALLIEGNQVKLEQRAANNPDISLEIFPEAIRRLSRYKEDNMTDLSIEICREIVADNIRFSLESSPKSLLLNGYIKVIAEAGPDFLSFIKDKGLSNVSTLVETVKSLKKSS